MIEAIKAKLKEDLSLGEFTTKIFLARSSGKTALYHVIQTYESRVKALEIATTALEEFSKESIDCDVAKFWLKEIARELGVSE